MFNLGMGEIMVILVVALVFLGPKKLPELASGLGKMIREVRKATADIKTEIELDDAIRKPLEELREATMLPPEELKRRDLERADMQRREKEARAESERLEKEEADRVASEEKDRQDRLRALSEGKTLITGSPAGGLSSPLDKPADAPAASGDKTIAFDTGAVAGAPPSGGPPPGLAGRPLGSVPRSTVLGVGAPAPAPAAPLQSGGTGASKLPPPPVPGRAVPPPNKKA